MTIAKILGRTSLRPAQVERLAALAELETFTTNVPRGSEQDVVSRASGAGLVVVNVFTPMTSRVVSALPELRAIVSCSAGIDHVDLEACRAAGVQVRWFPGYCARTVAEKTMCAILMGLNRIVPAIDDVRAGRWSYLSHQAREAPGRSVAVIGRGATGTIVQELCEAFGFVVRTASSSTTPAELREILACADVVTLHLPLRATTEHFLRAETLALLKPDVVIVNTARGGLVHDRDLVEFLAANQGATAFLDVLDTEPIQPDNPYLDLPNAVVTPHIGWNSVEADERLATNVEQAVVEELDAIRGGRGVRGGQRAGGGANSARTASE